MGLLASHPCGSPSKETFSSSDAALSPAAAQRLRSWQRRYEISEASRALLAAVKDGNFALVEKRLKGLAVPDCCDPLGVSPLHYAAAANRPDLVLLLLGSGASADAPGGGSELEGAPSVVSAARGHDACLAPLLNARAPPDARATCGDRPTALHLAAAAGHLGCARLLLAADYATAKAAGFGSLERAMLKPNQLLANHPDALGRLPLHAAVEHEQLDAAAVLLREGFSLVNVVHADGEGAIHSAVLAGPSDEVAAVRLVELLAAAGADLDLRDAEGQAPLHVAAAAARRRVCRTLLAHGADLFAQGRRGRSPLHCAARAGAAEVCLLLLQAQADPHALDDSKATPLTCSASAACAEALSLGMLRLERGEYATRGCPDGQFGFAD